MDVQRQEDGNVPASISDVHDDDDDDDDDDTDADNGNDDAAADDDNSDLQLGWTVT